MNVIVLGGSAACPNPGQGSSAYLVQAGHTRILLDCGPDTLSELRKHIELDQIDHIVISHVHSDHTLDLVPYRYGMRLVPGLSQRRIPLWLPPGGMSFMQRFAAAFATPGDGGDEFFTSTFDMSEYDPEGPLELDPVTFTFFRTNHPVPCWAMRLETDAGVLVYMADTGPQEDLVDIARDADILICEGTIPDHDEVAGSTERPHISAFEAGTIAREANARIFVLTHIFAKYGTERYLQAATDGFGKDVILARPGLNVSFPD